MASGGFPPRRTPLLSVGRIACQKISTNTDPIVMASTPKIVIAVAAWVRRTRLEQNSPNAPIPRAVTIRTTYPRRTSSGATPP